MEKRPKGGTAGMTVDAVLKRAAKAGGEAPEAGAMDEWSGAVLANADVWEELAQKSVRWRQRLVAQLQQVERALVKVDQLLRVSQPPKPGKLGVRWWRVQTRDAFRTPVLVRWKQLKGGRWRSERVQRVVATEIRRDGTSGVNAAQTHELARLASRLIAVHGKWVARLRKLDAEIAKGETALHLELEAAAGVMRAAHKSVTANLLNAGYMLDAATMGLLDSLD